ncbi:hypothetical protein SAMN05443575_3631 [Jatrophihabitans endophyticus]|uniref:Uncharacterized protein n=1 Tax=Jatrophihabitans endophyticus TaxID=1206085 RepID=A0A1M5RS32_9ACTN|nr:hypothetical protein [Jatrophihabitans endophyticus]SHH29087.1 hypothetical protein SAMN05443575_3631 [Jatrophihabitans endophyticus]
MAVKHFMLFLDKNASMHGLEHDKIVRGTGDGGMAVFTIVDVRAPGEGFDKDITVHVKSSDAPHFDGAHPITRIEYGPRLTRADVTECHFLNKR